MRSHVNRKRGSPSAVLAAFLSVFIHLLILAARFYSPVPPTPESQTERVIELSQLPTETPELDQKMIPIEPKSQIVETEDSGNRDIDPNAKLFSDKNQKAEQQTRAMRTDDFTKGKGTGASTEQSTEELDEGISESDVPSKKKSWKTLSLKDLSVGGDGEAASASDDYLPNVASGERTILSTREFRYFSYYNRIKELLRQYWKPSVEREVAKMWGKGRMLRESELITRVLVLLDKTGHIQKISKIGHSGIEEIDDMAVQAFEKAAPFPNPPNGLMDPDGFVRINWDFILQTASAPTIQFRPGRAAVR